MRGTSVGAIRGGGKEGARTRVLPNDSARRSVRPHEGRLLLRRSIRRRQGRRRSLRPAPSLDPFGGPQEGTHRVTEVDLVLSSLLRERRIAPRLGMTVAN